MRGSPLQAAFAAFLVIGLLGFPLWRLTHPDVRATTPPPVLDEPAEASVRFEIDFTLPAESVTVDHLGKALWSAERPGFNLERDAKLAWPEEGIDLRVRVAWPDDAPLSAARIRVTDPNGREHERSIFSRGPADEVLTFQ